MIEIPVTDEYGKPISKPEIRTIENSIQAEEAYGGDLGLKLYIKYRMVHLIRRLQDSSVNIKEICLTKINVSRRNEKSTHNI